MRQHEPSNTAGDTGTITVIDGNLTIRGRVTLRAEGYVVRYTIRSNDLTQVWGGLHRTSAIEVLEHLGYGIVSARGLLRAATPAVAR